MKTESEDLLSALFGEATEARAATLESVVKGARHRRRALAARRLGVAAMTLLAVGIALWLRTPGPSLANDSAPGSPADSLIVRTVPLAGESFVSSRMEASDTVRSTADGVTVVQTTNSVADHRAITDDELMALVAGRPAALVSVAGRKRLVFAGEAGWSLTE